MNTSIESLTLIVSSLQARIAELLERLAERDAKIASLQLIIEDLQKDNSDIRDRFNTNSRNSSKPPSSDGLSKPPAPVSLRKKSGKKSGGQKGHAGSTLTQISNPNHVIRHSLHTCPGCGSSLENQECLRLSARQVFDIPLPETIVTEHQIEHKHCRKCKKTVRSSYPKTVEGPVQYGPNIRSWSVYLQNQHFIPGAPSKAWLILQVKVLSQKEIRLHCVASLASTEVTELMKRRQRNWRAEIQSG